MEAEVKDGVGDMVVNMSSAFTSSKQGLNEAIEYSNGRVGKAAVHEFGPLEVKRIRSKNNKSCSAGKRAGTLSDP